MKRKNYAKLTSSSLDEMDSDLFELLELGEEENIFNHSFKFKDRDNTYRAKVDFIYAELLLHATYRIVGKEVFTLADMETIFSGLHNRYLPKVLDRPLTVNEERFIIQANILLGDYFPLLENKRNLIKHYLKENNEATTSVQMFYDANKKNTKLRNKSSTFRIGYKEPFVFGKIRINAYKKLLTDSKFISLTENRVISKQDITDFLEERMISKRDEDHNKKILEYINSIDTEFVESMGGHYPVVWSNMEVVKLQDIVDGSVHIIGKTGVGKTVLSNIRIKKLVDEGCKILLVLDNHNPNTLNRKLALEELGIKASIVMGRKRDKHINSFLKAQEGESVVSTMLKHKDLFHNLDSTCPKSEKSWKCTNCRGNIECGFLEQFRRVKESDVIITTPFNLLSSLVPKSIDKYRLSLLETLTQWADVIDWDEAEKLMEIGDDQLLADIKIFGLKPSASHDNEVVDTYISSIVTNLNRVDVGNIQDLQIAKNKALKLEATLDYINKEYLSNNSSRVIHRTFGTRRFTMEEAISKFIKNYVSTVRYEGDDKLTSNDEALQNLLYRMLKVFEMQQTKIRELLKVAREEGTPDDFSIRDENFSTIEVHRKLFNSLIKLISNVEPNMFEEDDDEELLKPDDYYKAEYKTIKINFKKHRNEEKEMEKIYLLGFIAFIITLDIELQELYKRLPSIYARYNLDIAIPLNPNPKNYPLAPQPPVTGFTGFSIEEVKDGSIRGNRLVHNLYTAIGREILFNTARTTAILNHTQPPLDIYSSATSTGTWSSKGNIGVKPTHLLKTKKEKKISTINMKCHVVEYNNKPVYISGSPLNERTHKIKLLGEYLHKFIKDTYISTEYDGGFLIGVNSYETAKTLFESLCIPGLVVKMLYNEKHMSEFDSKFHVNKLDLEKGAKNINVLIAINTIVNRGLNMMSRDEQSSHFRHIVPLERSLPTQNDLATHVSYVHHAILSTNSLSHLRAMSYDVLKTIRFIPKFVNLGKHIHSSIIGNLFVSVKQLIGRGQRGGSDVMVHFVDSAFYPETAEALVNGENVTHFSDKDNYKTSVLLGWISMLDDDPQLRDLLYDDIYKALMNMEIIYN